MAPPVKELPPRQRAPKQAPRPGALLAEDGTQLQVRITELPVAVEATDSDRFEVSQAGVSKQVTLLLMRQAIQPDLKPFLTGIIGGTGILVLGGAPVPTVELAPAGAPGTFGDAGHVPEITVDEYGRVSAVTLIPVAQPDVSGFAPIDSPAFTGIPTAPTAAPGNHTAQLATTNFVNAEILAHGYAPLASPAFTGNPTAPTPAYGDADTSIATTRFVEDRVAAIVPVDLSGYAPIASPAFTGTPTAPTPPTIDSTQKLATTAFVKAALAAGGASISVGPTPPPSPAANALWWNSEAGQLLLYYTDADTSQWVPASPAAGVTQAIPPGSGMDYFGGPIPTGWYACDGSLKNRITDAPLFAAIGTTYGAGDGTTTFALPDMRGRVAAGTDGGSGRLTAVITGGGVGSVGGDQNLMSHAHSPGSLQAADHLHAAGSITAPAHGHGVTGGNTTPASYTSRAGQGDGGGVYTIPVDVAGPWTCYGSTGAADRALLLGGATAAAGAGGAQNVQPTMLVNKLIKR